MCAENIKMKQRNPRSLRCCLLLLLGTVAVSVMVSEDAFARDGRYTGDTSQATSVSNECLNSILDSNDH